MAGNFEDFTREQVRALLQNQGNVGPAMARHVAERTGRSERNIIAASAAIGNFDPSNLETIAQAQARFVEAYEEHGISRHTLSKSSQEKIIYFAVALLVAGLLARCAIDSNSGESTLAEPSGTYAQCEAQLKPKLNKCLQGPQSTWEACGEAYMSELKSCTAN